MDHLYDRGSILSSRTRCFIIFELHQNYEVLQNIYNQSLHLELGINKFESSSNDQCSEVAAKLLSKIMEDSPATKKKLTLDLTYYCSSRFKIYP
uniref:Uncharacterized protein n=1 Tax=Romanomermis culicivorax TaxID=13658 RepID=A0A915L6Z5_ROMCU